VVGATGFTVTVFAMVVATIPPPGTTAPWLFEAKVLGGASAFVAAGGLVYWRARRLAGRAPLLRAPAGQEA
jgi:protein-S-isoprenylcysteine O-methyltransferase Ste14